MANNATLHFDVHGNGEPLLLLHGFTGASENWAATVRQWSDRYQLVVPDLPGHGRSGTLARPFRHRDAAAEVLALLDRLGIPSCKGLGISCGGNVLLHMATMQPERVASMVLVSATPWYPESARTVMRQHRVIVSERQWEVLRQTHPGGHAQIQALLESAESFADSHDDMNFTPPLLATIRARSLIVQGDRDPLYPVELSVEMARAIPNSSLWIVPNAGHGPVIGDKWDQFLATADAFLRG